MRPFHFDRTWTFTVGPDELWAVLVRTDDFRRWWPWLARLEVGGNGTGSAARLMWDMELRRPVLRAAARFGRPVMEWGHDWVVTTGVEQFLRRALRVNDGYDDDDGDRDHRS